MARKPKQKPQPEPSKSFDEGVPFESDASDDDTPTPEPEVPPPNTKLRDWRDVERFKELRNLRKLVDDDLDVDLD
ncbi:MAG: hypothetical protein ACT4PZ_04060 [Panacagrimonas sp.]